MNLHANADKKGGVMSNIINISAHTILKKVTLTASYAI